MDKYLRYFTIACFTFNGTLFLIYSYFNNNSAIVFALNFIWLMICNCIVARYSKFFDKQMDLLEAQNLLIEDMNCKLNAIFESNVKSQNKAFQEITKFFKDQFGNDGEEWKV